MRRLALACALTLACVLPAAAQTADTREARLEAARAHVALTLEDLDMPALIRTMYQPVIDQLAAGGQALREDQIAAIDQLYQSTMAEPLRRIMAEQDQIMADLFTLEEIEALAAFYASPLGRQVMTKLPQMVEAQQPQILAMVQTELPRLIPELQRIIGR
jgi:hypothetical protein